MASNRPRFRIDQVLTLGVEEEFVLVDSDTRTTAPRGPEVLRSGSFRSLEHATTGKAIVLRRPGGSLILRLERLNTSNGPDLRVYLSRIPASSDLHAYRTGFIDLGALKGNRGSQNYLIPAGTDLSAFKSAVIWCRRFVVGFGVAPLSTLSCLKQQPDCLWGATRQSGWSRRPWLHCWRCIAAA